MAVKMTFNHYRDVYLCLREDQREASDDEKTVITTIDILSLLITPHIVFLCTVTVHRFNNDQEVHGHDYLDMIVVTYVNGHNYLEMIMMT